MKNKLAILITLICISFSNFAMKRARFQPEVEKPVEAVQAIVIETEEEVTSSQQEKNRLLLESAKTGNLPMLLQALQEGADVNAQDTTGVTALMRATAKGHIGIVKELLAHKDIKVNAQDSNGWTALIIVAQIGHIDIAKELLAHNATNVDAQNKIGSTPLMIASAYGNVQIAKELLEKGAVVNLKNNQQLMPLTRAVKEGHFNVVQVLLEHGANVNDITKQGLSLLALALKNFGSNETANFNQIIELLVIHGADIQTALNKVNENLSIYDRARLAGLFYAPITRGKQIFNCIFNAARTGGAGLLSELSDFINNGYSLLIQDSEGNTPLHYAFMNRHANVVGLILTSPGGKKLLNVKNKTGQTPLDLAPNR